MVASSVRRRQAWGEVGWVWMTSAPMATALSTDLSMPPRVETWPPINITSHCRSGRHGLGCSRGGSGGGTLPRTVVRHPSARDGRALSMEPSGHPPRPDEPGPEDEAPLPPWYLPSADQPEEGELPLKGEEEPAGRHDPWAPPPPETGPPPLSPTPWTPPSASPPPEPPGSVPLPPPHPPPPRAPLG